MKETWDKSMPEKSSECGRAEDLVAYLYQEATQAEARDFENHMQHCASCRAEMKGFKSVREAIGEWHQQALGTIPSPAIALAPAKDMAGQRRSALNALREFFALSPLWMRAATAAVALIFCTLAIIAVAHFAEQPKVVVVERPGSADNAPGNNKTEVAGTDRQQNATNTLKRDQSESPQTIVAAQNEGRRTGRQIKPLASTSRQQLARQRRQALPRNNARPSEELASANDYLPFTVPSREDKVPSLVDLVEEPN